MDMDFMGKRRDSVMENGMFCKSNCFWRFNESTWKTTYTK
jgi:hypothetical protein